MRFAGWLFLVGLQIAAVADPLAVGGRKQLFIDDRFIARQENVVLTMNPAQKLGPITDATGARIYGHVSRVWEEGGKVRLYVGADRVDLYESEDGQHFVKTAITVDGGIATTLYRDDHDPDPARRYKKFWVDYSSPFDPEKHGVYAGYSADGVNFTTVGRVLPLYPDNPALVHWDARIGKYVIYLRALAYDSENQRRIARIETDDPLQPWPYNPSTHEGMFFNTEHANVVLAMDEEDNPYSDFYYNCADLYPHAQDVYLMFTSPFRHFSRERNPYVVKPGGGWEDFGLLETQLAVSRDGIHWSRPSREAYIPTGLADEWDRWYVVTGPGMARRGNYLYQYYAASGRTHDSAYVREEYVDVPTELGGIGAVRQRLDGFVSANVDHRGGWLETPPLVFEGTRLRLNIDTGAMGTAFVELRDAEGTPIPGYTLEDCEEIGGNFLDQRVYWKGNPDVAALAGRPVRVYVKLIRAKLFAFQFTPE